MATAPSAPSTGRMVVVSVVIAAIVGAIAGFGAGFLARPSAAAGFWSSSPTARTVDVYLFTGVQGEPFDENAVGQFPDIFIPDEIIVNRGDTVRIHFYNTENASEGSEFHSFTMDAPYQMDHQLDSGENVTFTIVASTAGVFQFRCTFHPPVMVGWLTVLG